MGGWGGGAGVFLSLWVSSRVFCPTPSPPIPHSLLLPPDVMTRWVAWSAAWRRVTRALWTPAHSWRRWRRRWAPGRKGSIWEWECWARREVLWWGVYGQGSECCGRKGVGGGVLSGNGCVEEYGWGGGGGGGGILEWACWGRRGVFGNGSVGAQREHWGEGLFWNGSVEEDWGVYFGMRVLGKKCVWGVFGKGSVGAQRGRWEGGVIWEWECWWRRGEGSNWEWECSGSRGEGSNWEWECWGRRRVLGERGVFGNGSVEEEGECWGRRGVLKKGRFWGTRRG